MLLIVCSFTHDQPGGSQLAQKQKNQQIKKALLLFTFFTVALSKNILDIDSIHVRFKAI